MKLETLIRVFLPDAKAISTVLWIVFSILFFTMMYIDINDISMGYTQ